MKILQQPIALRSALPWPQTEMRDDDTDGCALVVDLGVDGASRLAARHAEIDPADLASGALS